MSSPLDPSNRDDYCYRHPDRQSFALCQRCGRTICGECQTQSAVGVLCPEEFRAERRAASPAGRFSSRMRGLARAGAPVVTYAIMAIAGVAYVLQFLLPFALGSDVVGRLLMYGPVFTTLAPGAPFEPWRMLTYAFVHGSILHIAFNLITLWMFGRVLEQAFGPLRYALLFIVAAMGGALATAIVAPGSFVIGASGAIFGMFGAYFFVMRQARMDTRSLLVLVAINVVMGFVVSGIAWQAHIGGLVVGGAAGAILVRDARRAAIESVRFDGGAAGRSRRLGNSAGLWGLVGLGVAVAALTIVFSTLNVR